MKLLKKIDYYAVALYLLLGAFALGTLTSCGALEKVAVDVVVRPCTSYYATGVWGYGLYDCNGRLLYTGSYAPVGFYNSPPYYRSYRRATIAPRVIVKKRVRRVRTTKRRVVTKTRRKS